MRRGIVIGIIVWMHCFVFGQDIHFTQFDKSPVMLNPSLTGNFDGDWRYTFNQRSQWRSVSRSYNTFGLSLENRRALLLPNLYYAFNYMNDVAGDGDYRTHELNFSTAYQISLSKDSSGVLVPSIQFGFNHKAIDFNAFKYDVQFNGYKYDENLPSNEAFLNERYSNLNLAVGLAYFKQFKNEARLEIGSGLFNIVDKTETFMGNQSLKRSKRLALHGRFIYPTASDWDLMPGVLFQSQGAYKELIFGANFRHVNVETGQEYIAPYAGLWFRNKDAVNLVAGLYYNNWIGGVSYDINISELSPASNVRGGLEFSLQYIVNIFKPKNLQYRVCPDYL